jgi:hypothetical protein
MDTTGLGYGISNVLRNYYRHNFTDSKTWQQLESIRFDGTLHLAQGVVRFTAFKKKPDHCKVVIFASNGGRIVMAYDGADAWQLNTLQPEAQAIAMPEAEALNFIRDATTGGHLLYPLIEGKTITLAGTADVDGQRAYHLQIQLPDGQQVQSFLDMTSFAEIRQITTNNLNGDEEVITHSDFRQIDGICVPFISTLTVDGQQIHQVRMYNVQTDIGVMPWMFARPAGANLELSRNGTNIPNSPDLSEVGRHALMPQLSARERGSPNPPFQVYSREYGSEPARDTNMWAPSDFDPNLLSPHETKSLSGQIGQPATK